MVKAAAILVDGEVWTLPRPVRHCHLIEVWSNSHWQNGKPGRIGEHIQGFVDDKGNFIDRQTAAEIAFACGQIDKPKKTLFSEDLW